MRFLSVPDPAAARANQHSCCIFAEPGRVHHENVAGFYPVDVLPYLTLRKRGPRGNLWVSRSVEQGCGWGTTLVAGEGAASKPVEARPWWAPPETPAPFPSLPRFRNGPRRQGFASPRLPRAPLTAPGRSEQSSHKRERGLPERPPPSAFSPWSRRVPMALAPVGPPKPRHPTGARPDSLLPGAASP